MMGGTSWSDAAYHSRVVEDKTAGKDTFDYSKKVSSGAVETKAHETLDPKLLKNGIREARDSAEHPNSKPVFVGLDVTGSMRTVPQQVQAKLPTLMGLLTRKGYLADPAICISAIGDVDYGHAGHVGDKVPFQVGQFESGIEVDDDIRNLFMEGGGGGNDFESYEIALFFLAHCVKFDAWEKRQQKGYAFIICDESLNKTLPSSRLRAVFGDCIGQLGSVDYDVDKLIIEVEKRWELFCIIPKMTQNYDDPRYSKRWRDLLGQRVLKLDDPDGIAELIASTIGVIEENTDVDSLAADLTGEGASAAVADSVSRALAVVGGDRGISKLAGKTGLATL
jgi:hypothetical protein